LPREANARPLPRNWKASRMRLSRPPKARNDERRPLFKPAARWRKRRRSAVTRFPSVSNQQVPWCPSTYMARRGRRWFGGTALCETPVDRSACRKGGYAVLSGEGRRRGRLLQREQCAAREGRAARNEPSDMFSPEGSRRRFGRSVGGVVRVQVECRAFG